MLYLWTHAWQGIKTYDDEEYEVDEVVEGMSVHDVVHDLHPALQRDHLHKPEHNQALYAPGKDLSQIILHKLSVETNAVYDEVTCVCYLWSDFEGRVSNFVTIHKMYNFIRFRSIKRTTTSLI